MEIGRIPSPSWTETLRGFRPGPFCEYGRSIERLPTNGVDAGKRENSPALRSVHEAQKWIATHFHQICPNPGPIRAKSHLQYRRAEFERPCPALLRRRDFREPRPIVHIVIEFEEIRS